jgi:hypothetical protein
MTVPGHRYKTMRLPYMAILNWSLNPADISTCISAIHLCFYQPTSICFPSITIHYHAYRLVQSFCGRTVKTPGRGACPSGGDSAERGRGVEGGSGTESGGRTEGSSGSRKGGTGGGGDGNDGAFWPQTHHPCTCQYRVYGIWLVNSVKGKEEGGRRGAIHFSVHRIYSIFIPC